MKHVLHIWASLGPCAWSNRIKDSKTLVQPIADCRKLFPNVLTDNTELLNTIEIQTRLVCYKLHLKRLSLCKINKEISSVGVAADPPSILSQSYNATVFYFDNIFFLAHVLNQLLLLNESSISQASTHTIIVTICFQLFKKQTILWR